MRDYVEGRDVFLASSDDVASAFRQGYEVNRDELSVMMSKITHTVRTDVF